VVKCNKDHVCILHASPARPRVPPNRYSPRHYGLSIVLEMTSYRDGKHHPKWQLAMAKKIVALERSGTCNVVSPPPSDRSIMCKWVYKMKTPSEGSLDCYKATSCGSWFSAGAGL
jgi:hypothetical protein